MAATSGRLSVLLGLCLLLAAIRAEVDGITAEDVRFASGRCQNESTKDPLLRAQWARRDFPDDHETHCYTKCLLSKLGLINLVHRGLHATKIMQLLGSQEAALSDECYELLDDRIGERCEAYYRRLMDVRAKCEGVFDAVLPEDTVQGTNVSQSGKIPGESATEFCSKILQDSTSKELTSDQVIGSDMLNEFKCELECVFRHFRFFDAYGRVIEAEISRAYREAGTDCKSNSRVIAKCAHRSNALFALGQCEMAYELYRCLLKESKAFRKTYKNRDKITRLY